MTSNGKHDESSLPPPNSGDLLLEAWRDVLGETLAQERASWARERALIEAQAAQIIAELRATIVEMRADHSAKFTAWTMNMQLAVDERLAKLRDGEKGEQGERGFTGDKGPQGDAGQPGEHGQKGDPGARGESGEKGEPGSQGDKGEPGQPGEKGEKGDAGERGERGEKGDAGEKGDQGLQGNDGQHGEKGDPGPQGLQGLAGDRGEKGETGDAGGQGAQGPEGLVGAAGPAGAQGQKGEQGERGAAGPQGEKGLTGDRGEQGTPGRIFPAKRWKPGITYEGEVVTHAGATWQARRDTPHAPHLLAVNRDNESDWDCLAAAGQDARTPVVRGTFDPEATYSALDIVALNANSFIARRDNPGPCPGDGWQVMTQGKRGVAGERGTQGERGPKGEAGERGGTIKSWKLDRERYVATPVMSDGSSGPSLELRALFEQYVREAG